MIEVFRYRTEEGQEPLTDWLQSLQDKQAQAKIRAIYTKNPALMPAPVTAAPTVRPAVQQQPLVLKPTDAPAGTPAQPQIIVNPAQATPGQPNPAGNAPKIIVNPAPATPAPATPAPAK